VKTFTLELRGAMLMERIEDVRSFVGSDESGSFGLLAGHEPFITCLGFGLARFQRVGSPWEYLALPGAVLHLHQGELLLCTRRYFRGTDYGRISALLREELAEEERDLAATRGSLRRLEREMLRRLWELGRGREALP
jgi:F-type H+-transporting ATPase subunit epsilon